MNTSTTLADQESERGLLSSVCKDTNNLSDALDAKVDGSWFTLPLHQRIWEQIIEIEEPSDLMDVDVMLKFPEVDRQDVMSVLGSCEMGFGFDGYLQNVQECFQKREIRKIAMEISQSIDENQKSDEIINVADQKLTSLAIDKKETVRDAREVVNSMWENIQKRMEVGGMNGIPCGISSIDRTTNGWQPSDLIVVAARTSVGKTAFGCELALNALKKNKSVLFFSLEMKAEAVMQRFISNLSEVPLTYIIDKTSTQEQLEKYMKSMEWMKNKNLWVDDRGLINSNQVRAKARKYARKGLDFIVVDYAQKMSPVDRRVPREQQVAEISGSMKALAMELNVPVILLSQLNRGADEKNRKPRLSDMRESGALEQDADICALLWRENDDPKETVVSISKHRQGGCGDFPVCFEPKIQKFTPRPKLN